MSSWRKTGGSEQAAFSDKPKEPHVDYNNNLYIVNNLIRKKQIPETPLEEKNKHKLCYSFTGTNKRPDGSYGVLTAIIFSWKTRGVNFGCPINLHQSTQNVREDLGTFFDEAL